MTRKKEENNIEEIDLSSLDFSLEDLAELEELDIMPLKEDFVSNNKIDLDIFPDKLLNNKKENKELKELKEIDVDLSIDPEIEKELESEFNEFWEFWELDDFDDWFSDFEIFDDEEDWEKKEKWLKKMPIDRNLDKRRVGKWLQKFIDYSVPQEYLEWLSDHLQLLIRNEKLNEKLLMMNWWLQCQMQKMI